MNRAENSASIPIDLILEILSRLPSKSVGRFHCVSKLWRSMLSGPYFTELYLTKSYARPRLLFAVDRVGEELQHFYSSPQPHIPYDNKSSLVVAADYHMTLPSERCNYASGLICFHGWKNAMTVICNPITGQYAKLPKMIMYDPPKTLLGFDPVEKQFKVLLQGHSSYCFQRGRDQILTLGVSKLEWRSNIVCPRYYRYLSEGICINGVIYYVAYNKEFIKVIICFDVRHEEFKVIKAEYLNDPATPILINYKDKLGGIIWNPNEYWAINLCLWVLHDVEKQEWSSYVYSLPEIDVFKLHNFTISGMTTRGEFVFSMMFTTKPFYVFYFNPEKNTLERVEIQGFGEDLSRVKVFVDHVEDFKLLR